MPTTLRQMGLAGDIDIHSDILSVAPSALSMKRALKANREPQTEMVDETRKTCVFCEPNSRPPDASPYTEIITGRVGGFLNDYPYMPQDQWVFSLWHPDQEVRVQKLHRYRLADFTALELYWLFKACVERGRQFEAPRASVDTWRMVVGFNLGRLAGQSIPHFHAQYGWEVALNPKIVKKNELALYFDELREQHLMIYSGDRVSLVAPWTPKGQFATELYFHDRTFKYEFRELDDFDIRLFAVFGEKIIAKYVSLGIQNVNIVFTNSPVQRETEPLVAHFVPRVNMTALYEIRGVNVVDTPPRTIAVEFTRLSRHGSSDTNLLWTDVAKHAAALDPDGLFELRTAQGRRPNEATGLQASTA